MYESVAVRGAHTRSVVTLAFEVPLKPVGLNNLYPGKRHRYAAMAGKLFKQHILDAALDAADRQGWDLVYDGCVRINVVEFRVRRKNGKAYPGVDVDSIGKAIIDALQPEIIRNDSYAWEGRTRILESDRTRLIVVVERVTRAEIAAETQVWLREVFNPLS